MNAWMCLLFAGLLEVVWAGLLKRSDGFSRPWESVGAILGMMGSFYLLSRSMKTLPLSVSYAVWTGIGIVGGSLIGAVVFHEPVSLRHVVCILLILVGIVGLRF